VRIEESWSFVLRKPLGRLALAVLASVAIPLSFVPAASAADQYNAPSVSASAFVDNTATGVDLGDGFGMLRINSTAGFPEDITSSDFTIVGKAYQAEEDARSYEVKVQFKGHKSFKKDKPSVSWHCGGGGHQPPTHPTKPTKPTSETPTTSETTPSTSDTTPSDTTSSSPTSDTSTTETTPSAPDSTTETTTPSAPDTTSSTPVDTTSSAPTSAATTTTSAPGGGTVTCPVKPVGTIPTGPQQVVRPVSAPETGFGGMA
jgi:hypothetical protein